MQSEVYNQGYFEHGDRSNYHNYGDDPGWVPTVQAMLSHALPEWGPWAEIACAKGYFVKAARDAGADAYGIDVSEYAISQAPDAVKPYVQQASAVALPWEGDKFDVVCSWEFLEHVPEDELDQVLAEMERVGTTGAVAVNRIGLETPGHVETDLTHVTMHGRQWWHEKFASRCWVRLPMFEAVLDKAFEGRDWHGRFFAYMMQSKVEPSGV